MKFVLLLTENEEKNPVPEDGPAFEAYMAPWLAYSQALADAGVIVGGEPLERVAHAKTVRVKDGKRIVEDGPFADMKEQLGGFYIIDVKDEAAALDWAAKCPAAKSGTVEVRPVPVWGH